MKTFPKISITGDLGSGKSHVSRILSAELGIRIVSTGFIQREIAEKYNMTTLELNEYTKTHPEIDDEIDGTISKLQEADESLIFDSRLAWYFAPKSFKIYLTVDIDEAARRIFNDKRTSEKYQNMEEAKNKILARRKSELERFISYYHIDYSDLNNYDLIVTTSHTTPEEVSEKIIKAYRQWEKK